MAKVRFKHFTDAEIKTINIMTMDGATDTEIGRTLGRKTMAIRNKKNNLRRLGPGKKATARALKTPDSTALIDLIVQANVPKDQKIKCLEALL